MRDQRLTDPTFRRGASEATGLDEATLEASAVGDPYATVVADVERLLASPLVPRGLGVSGHVYDVETGRVPLLPILGIASEPDNPVQERVRACRVVSPAQPAGCSYQ